MARTPPCANDERRHGVNPGAQPPSHPIPFGTCAVVYLHVSASQPAAATNRSIAAQREACRREAAELGFSLINEHAVLEPPDRNVTMREVIRRLRADVRKPSTAARAFVSISRRSRWPSHVRRQPQFSPRPTHQEVP